MDTYAYFPWFILLAPLVSSVLIQLFTRKSHGLRDRKSTRLNSSHG